MSNERIYPILFFILATITSLAAVPSVVERLLPYNYTDDAMRMFLLIGFTTSSIIIGVLTELIRRHLGGTVSLVRIVLLIALAALLQLPWVYYAMNPPIL